MPRFGVTADRLAKDRSGVKDTGTLEGANAEAPTRIRIIETAERLFSLEGLDGISMRRVAAEAGCSNTSAVAYHFGNKEGLVNAIFAYRLQAFEVARAQAFARAVRLRSADTPRGLMEVLLRPFADQVDSFGGHSYAALLLELVRTDGLTAWRASAQPRPITEDIVARLTEALGLQPGPCTDHHVTLAISTFLLGLVRLDARSEARRPGATPPAYVDYLIDLATAVVQQPLSRSAV